MVLFADEERDEGKEVDGDGGGGGTKKKGKKMKRPTERLEDVGERRGNKKETKKRTERDGLSSFAYLLHYSE